MDGEQSRKSRNPGLPCLFGYTKCCSYCTNVLIGFANTIWVAYSKRTRYRANRRVSIRAKFIEQLNMALVTPLTVEQVAEIRYGERPDLNGPGNNPIL